MVHGMHMASLYMADMEHVPHRVRPHVPTNIYYVWVPPYPRRCVHAWVHAIYCELTYTPIAQAYCTWWAHRILASMHALYIGVA